ncbi:hypothetical protein ACLOAU_08835 [Niabella sp. CJ426]|uniref:hypothetical protein n=1 Tax=Niabella sp. CJ426 TaxID=3393740 RepID=UPI003CFC6C55
MKRPAIAALLLTSGLTLNAQKYKVNIQAGVNTTFISKFDNTNVYAENFSIPGYYQLNTAGQIRSMSARETRIQKRPGFFADIAVEKMLQNNWSLSLSLGVNQVYYTYNGFIGIPEYSGAPGAGDQVRLIDLKSIEPDYGDTKMLYLTSRAFNVSKKWSRFTVTAGPQLNYLLSKKYTNTILLDTDPSKEGYEDGIFEARGDANKLLIGATLSAKYHITHRLYLVAGGQKWFSSLYEKQNTSDDVHRKSRPIQAELGIGYNITGF